MKIQLKAMLQFIGFGIFTVILFYGVCIWLPTRAGVKTEDATIRPAPPPPYLPADANREEIQG